MLAPESHHPKASGQGRPAQLPYHHPYPRVLLPAAAGGGLGKPPPLRTPACGPGLQGQCFEACFSRSQPLPSQAASRAGSQRQKTLSNLAETHTRGDGRAHGGEPLGMGTRGTHRSAEPPWVWRVLASCSQSDAAPGAASSSQGCVPLPSTTPITPHPGPHVGDPPTSPHGWTRPERGEGSVRPPGAGQPLQHRRLRPGTPPSPAPPRKQRPREGKPLPAHGRTDGRSDGLCRAGAGRAGQEERSGAERRSWGPGGRGGVRSEGGGSRSRAGALCPAPAALPAPPALPGPRSPARPPGSAHPPHRPTAPCLPHPRPAPVPAPAPGPAPTPHLALPQPLPGRPCPASVRSQLLTESLPCPRPAPAPYPCPRPGSSPSPCSRLCSSPASDQS